MEEMEFDCGCFFDIENKLFEILKISYLRELILSWDGWVKWLVGF